jgi:GNAT superfamily N-acetyltransferase
MVSLRIEPLDPDDVAAVAAVSALYAAADAADRPWHPPYRPAFIRTLATHGWDDGPIQFFLGRNGAGTLVAAGDAFLPSRDNRHTALVGANVHPEHRNAGAGTAVLDHVESLATEAGRTRLFTGGPESDAGRRFVERRGYALGSVGVDRHVDLRAAGDDAIQAAFDEAAALASDYELLRVAGPMPDDLVDAYAVAAAAINDAPLDDLEIEDEIFDAERVRRYEQGQIGSGRRLYRVLARHRQTGDIAGHTVVAVETDPPGYGLQHDTTVVRAHRGHRLGLLLKADMMRWLRAAEPGTHTLATQNAASNSHMIAVNERLGYRVMGRSMEFQRDVPEASVASSHGAGSVTGTA